MDFESQLKVQSYLDAELPEGEAREVANWLARDQEAVGLHAELRNTRKAMAGFETGITLPESREFFWSKIEREIQRLEKPSPKAESASWLGALQRFLLPLGGVAALALAAILVNGQFGLLAGSGGETK